jgi:hypothetical protein
MGVGGESHTSAALPQGKKKKRTLYLSSLMMKVPDHVYVLG